MSFKFRLSIRGAEPPVVRTVSVPSGTTLYRTALIFVTAMGWPGGRHHRIAVDGDPATREIEDRAVVDDIVGEQVLFQYDPAHIWNVDCEYLGECDGDVPEVVDFEGDCPPQIMAGTDDYNRIMKAADDPSDPYHPQAVAWKGLVVPFDADAVNSKMKKGELAEEPYDFRKQSSESVSLLMDRMVEGKDVALVRDMTFRCPECGCVCDGRVDLDRQPALVLGTNRRPVMLICPECGTSSVLYMRNDGYRTGYTAEKDTRCMESLTDLYDLIHASRDGKRDADAECDMALADFRHRSRSDNMSSLLKAYGSLDGSDRKARCRLLGAAFALASTDSRVLDGKYYEDALSLREDFEGAVSVMAMSALAGRHPDDVPWYIARSAELIESDRESPLADRLIACKTLIDLAQAIGDKDTVLKAAGWLGPLTDEIVSHGDLNTSEWSAYCMFFDFLVTYLRWDGLDDDAEKAVKTASIPMADDWDEKIPVAVRNVVRFRRALLFLTSDGDREQAADDLKSIRDSLAENEDNGPVTCMRVFASLILMHWMNPSEKECLAPFAQMYAGVRKEGWLPEAYADLLFSHFADAFTGNGWYPGRLQGELRKLGLTVEIGKTVEFDPEVLWKYPLPEFT